MDQLGADLSNASISLSSSPSPPPQRGYLGLQPSTPIIVPPTPSPGNSAPRSGLVSASATPPSSSTSEVFYDAPEEIDYQTRRRSMYRASGTASSPDLATLLRKAKERGGGGGSKDGKRNGNSLSRDRMCIRVSCLTCTLIPCTLCARTIAWALGAGYARPQRQNEVFPKSVCSA